MNINQLINTIMRRVTRNLVNRGIDAGMAKVAGSGKGRSSGGQAAKQGTNASRAARETAKRARQAAKITRRLGR